MNKLTISTAIAASLSAFACGAADGSDEGAQQGEARSEASSVSAESVDGQVIEPTHEFVVGNTEYALVETSLGEFLLMGLAGPTVSKMPHDVLLEEHGQLTMLEIFLALAPDQEPSERLLDYHVVQADVYAREDLSVRQAVYVEPLINKAVTAQNCEDYAVSLVDSLPGTDPIDAWSHTQDGNPSIKIYFSPQATLNAEALSACNPNPSTFEYRFGWNYGNDAPSWFSWQDLPQNYMAAVYGGQLPGPTKRRHWIEWRDIPSSDDFFIGRAYGS